MSFKEKKKAHCAIERQTFTVITSTFFFSIHLIHRKIDDYHLTTKLLLSLILPANY
jgi:hypothetical protein